MGLTKIRAFKGLRDGKEDPAEFIEDIEWAYEQDYKPREPAEKDAQTAFYNKTHRILFRQNLDDDAFVWYSDLDGELKQDWPRLQDAFLPAFIITVKDAQTKKFELRVKLANLEQIDTENIADYLKKASELAIRLPLDQLDVGMATLRGMKDKDKRERVSFECNKDADYAFATVVRFIKASYSEIGKINPFDPGYKDAMRVTLPEMSAVSNEELMRQVLINTNQAFPALVQGMRALHTAQTKGLPIQQSTQSQAYPARDPDKPRKPLSEIKCFTCGQLGHYASYHTQAAPAAAAITEEEDEPEDNVQRSSSRALIIMDDTKPAMAAARNTANAKKPKPQQILQRPTGVKKPQAVRKKPQTYNPPQLPQHILDQIEAFNESQTAPEDEPEDMDTDDEEENQPPQRHPSQPTQSESANIQPPRTRVTKTGKVQELVAQKAPKLPDPIRGITSGPRFDIKNVFDLPIQLSLGELLDRSDTTIKELAYGMQRATPRYRVKRTTEASNPIAVPPNQGNVATLAAALIPPEINARAYEDDGQSQPVMIVSWIEGTKLWKTLLDGGSLVELLSRKKLNQLNPRPKVHTNGHLRVSLATDKIDTLTDYVKIAVNVEGVEALIKAWIVDVEIYDLLLGLSWLRRVHCNPHYGLGEITISGDDGQLRHVPAQITPMETGLPIVEFDEEDEESADLACQHLLDEQENARL